MSKYVGKQEKEDLQTLERLDDEFNEFCEYMRNNFLNQYNKSMQELDELLKKIEEEKYIKSDSNLKFDKICAWYFTIRDLNHNISDWAYKCECQYQAEYRQYNRELQKKRKEEEKSKENA